MFINGKNDISYIIRASIFRIYNALGYELLESACDVALKYIIEKFGLKVRSQVSLPIYL